MCQNPEKNWVLNLPPLKMTSSPGLATPKKGQSPELATPKFIWVVDLAIFLEWQVLDFVISGGPDYVFFSGFWPIGKIRVGKEDGPPCIFHIKLNMISDWLLIIYCWLQMISGWLWIISGWLLMISGWLVMISGWFLIVSGWLLMINGGPKWFLVEF